MLIARASPTNTLLVALAISAACFSLVAVPAHASTGLTIQPIKISLTLRPGETATSTILLTNASDSDVSVSETLQDFIPVAGAEGIQFIGRTEGVTTVRDWITLPGGGTDFLFKKGASREVEYRITAPPDAEPGSHFGVIFFKASDPSATGSLKVGTQVGVLVLVTIPGAHLQKGNIISFVAPWFTAGGPVPFTLRFQNTGTVYFEPKGQITITNMLGQKVGSVPIEGQVVLPTGVKDLHFDWQGDGLLFGQYRAAATVVDGDGNALTSREVTFYAAPLWYIGFFLFSVLVLFFIVKLARKHIRVTLR